MARTTTLRVTEIFREFEDQHLTKDPGLVLKHLHRSGTTCTAIAEAKDTLRSQDPDIPLIALQKPFFWHACRHLRTHAKQIDVLLAFHTHPLNPVYAAVLKHYNPQSIMYVKADMDETVLALKQPSLLNFARRIKIYWNLRSADIFSIEQDRIRDFLAKEYPRFSHKMILIPNGYGDTTPVRHKSFAQKENIILCVGRTGTRQKATDTVLKVIENIKEDLKGWRVILAGPISEEFQPAIKEFYKRNPELRKSVIFHGPTKNRKEMLELYNSAKILFMPSRWEGFSNVPAEAAHFGNVIIGTPVGGVRELTDNGSIGALCPIDDVTALSHELRRRVKTGRLLAQESRRSKEFCDRNYLWERIIERLRQRIAQEQRRKQYHR